MGGRIYKNLTFFKEFLSKSHHVSNYVLIYIIPIFYIFSVPIHKRKLYIIWKKNISKGHIEKEGNLSIISSDNGSKNGLGLVCLLLSHYTKNPEGHN